MIESLVTIYLVALIMMSVAVWSDKDFIRSRTVRILVIVLWPITLFPMAYLKIKE